MGQIFTFESGGVIKSWDVEKLWQEAEGKTPRKMSVKDLFLAHIDRYVEWENEKDQNHEQRVNDADLSFPLLFNEKYGLMDGLHRLIKAHAMGVTEIDVVDVLAEEQIGVSNT